MDIGRWELCRYGDTVHLLRIPDLNCRTCFGMGTWHEPCPDQPNRRRRVFCPCTGRPHLRFPLARLSLRRRARRPRRSA